MLTAEGRAETERPGRYLVQLCRHLNLVAQQHPQVQAHVDWSEDRGVISFGWGRCTLRADVGVLTLRAEAADEERLHQLQRRVAARLQQVGRHDQLAVTWTPPRVPASSRPRPPTDATEEDTHMADPPRPADTGGIPRWVKVSGIIVIVLVLLVGVVLLLGGGGGHRPRRHAPSDGPGGQPPPANVTASGGGAGHAPPAGATNP
jgi:hypothetical protein